MSMAETPSACSDVQDLFKEEFKRYKKISESDLSNVIDIRAPERFSNDVCL